MPVDAASSTPMISHGDGEAAAYWTKQPGETGEQATGDPRTVKQYAHEYEHGQGHHHPVLHDMSQMRSTRHRRVVPVDVGGNGEIHFQDDGEHGEPDSQATEHPCNGIAGKNEADEGDDHQQRQDFGAGHRDPSCQVRP